MDLIKVKWKKPILLEKHPTKHIPFWIQDWNRIPAAPGIYIFSKRFGDKITPVYIGKAKNLRNRIKQQLKSNVPLVTAMQKSGLGSKFVMIAEHIGRPGLPSMKAITIVEKAFIYEAINHGFELANIQMKEIKEIEIISEGYSKHRLPKLAKKISWKEA